MDTDLTIVALLTEIRDTQREHLRAYQEQAARAIALSQEAVTRQKRVIAFGKFVLLPILAIMIAYVVYLGHLLPLR